MSQILVLQDSNINLKEVITQRLISFVDIQNQQDLDQKFKTCKDIEQLKEQVFQQLQGNSYSAKQIISICDLLIHYLLQQKQYDLINQLIKNYIASSFDINLKLKLLGNLINIMNDYAEIKTKAIQQMFDLAISNKKLSLLYVALQNIQNILSNLDVNDRRIIYLQLYKALRQQNPRQTLDYAIEFLKQFETSNEAELEQNKIDILDAVKSIITSEQYQYNFGDILEFKAIQFLNQQEKELQDILKIFVERDFKQYLEFRSKNQNYVNKLQIDQDKFLNRLRISSIVHIADKQRKITFKEIAEYIQVPIEEVEDWVINAFENEVVTGKIDQYEQIIEFFGNQGNYFDQQDWQKLEQQLKVSSQNLQEQIENIEQKI